MGSVVLEREYQRQRPLWMVFALTIVTFGLYFFWWFAATWAEMKREIRDPGMSPAWHMMTQFVPIYGLFRIYNHFSTINDLAYTVPGGILVSPGWLLFWRVVSAIIAGIANRSEWLVFLGLLVLSDVVTGAVLVKAQHSLNSYYRGLEGRTVLMRARPLSWIGLMLGAAWWLLTLGCVAVGPFIKE